MELVLISPRFLEPAVASPKSFVYLEFIGALIAVALTSRVCNSLRR